MATFYTKESYYHLNIIFCNDKIANEFSIDNKCNSIKGNELYFKTKDDAVSYIKHLFEEIKRKEFKTKSGLVFKHIFNCITKKEDDYTFDNDYSLTIAIKTDEFVPKYYDSRTYCSCLMVSISLKTFTFVETK